jgi:hypothetical protein
MALSFRPYFTGWGGGIERLIKDDIRHPLDFSNSDYCCRYRVDWVPTCARLNSSPTAPASAPSREGLRSHHVSRGSRPTSWCERPLASPCATELTARYGRAPVSPHLPRLQTRLLVREGSVITTCPVWLGPPPAGKGTNVTTCPSALDPPPSVGGVWHLHGPRGSQPLRRARVFPRRLISGSSWPHQARRVGSELNAYKTSDTRHMASIPGSTMMTSSSAAMVEGNAPPTGPVEAAESPVAPSFIVTFVSPSGNTLGGRGPTTDGHLCCSTHCNSSARNRDHVTTSSPSLGPLEP